MSKSAFEKWWEKNNSDAFMQQHGNWISSRDECRAAWLAALRGALKQAEINPFDKLGQMPKFIDPDKIQAEIKKVEAEK
jgi:uncharacterized protein